MPREGSGQASDHLKALLGDRRIERPLPPGRIASVAADDDPDHSFGDDQAEASDPSAGATFFAVYAKASGEVTQRRLSIKQIQGHGRAERVLCYCHERRALRTFVIERFVELVDLETGELLDSLSFFEGCRAQGTLPAKDRAFHDMLAILVFIAECDDQFHPLEEREIEACLGSYFVRYGGREKDLEDAKRSMRKLSLDTSDFVHALERSGSHPDGRAMLRLVRQSLNRVASADGVIVDEEHRWLMAAADILDELST